MSLSVNAHPHFWKDVKEIHKKHKGAQFISTFGTDEFEEFGDAEKMDSIPICQSLKNVVVNSIEDGLIDQKSNKYDRQPFLVNGWVIRKMRFAIDNTGKRGGLRVIFCVNGNSLLFVYIATKNQCDDERQLESTFLKRIREYLV